MPRIFSRVDFMVAPESNPCTIAYNSAARTLLVILLHFMEDQCKIFALFSLSASSIMKPIWVEKSLLFANDESANTITFNELMSSFMNFNPLDEFSFCQLILLFSNLISDSFGSII